MNARRCGVIVGALVLLAVACSAGSVTGDGTGDGGSSNCPSAQPANGSACSSTGLSCSYGCGTSAKCSGGSWNILQSNISCATDGGAIAVGEGGNRLPDGAITCGSQNDCPSTLSCSPGGTAAGCGICAMPQNPCATDDDCKTIDDAAPPKPMVCGPGGACSCSVNGKTGSCILACQGPTDCSAEEACDMTTGHCVAKPCTSDADCPSNQSVDYACSAARVCAQKPCTTSADCGAHFCVNAICHPQQGICVPPAA